MSAKRQEAMMRRHGARQTRRSRSGPFAPFRDDKLIAGGRVSSMPGDEVRRNVMRIFEEGDLVAVISRDKDTGDLSVMVMGEPSLELADALDDAAVNYRKALP